MPPLFVIFCTSMTSFTNKRIIKFLRNWGYEADEERDLEFIQSIQDEAGKEKRKKLTRFFVEKIITLFLSTDKELKVTRVQMARPRRTGVNYTPSSPVSPAKTKSPVDKIKKKPTSQLLAILAQPDQGIKYAAIIEQHGKNMDSPAVEFLLEEIPEEKIRKAEELTLTPKRRHASGPHGTPYKRVLKTTVGDLYRQQEESETIVLTNTPAKTHLEKKFPGLHGKPNHFEFIVERQTILERLDKKRECSQKQVTGYSAADFFKELGVTIKKKLFGSHYHLCHVQGFSLGGKQAKNNLHAGSEGSNYTLLFYGEDPIRRMLLDEESGINTIKVHGQVIYHEEVETPKEIIYTITLDNGKTIEKIIEPLSYHKPTLFDNKAAFALFKANARQLFSDEEDTEDFLDVEMEKLTFSEFEGEMRQNLPMQ